jgi:hypothetical protein
MRRTILANNKPIGFVDGPKVSISISDNSGREIKVEQVEIKPKNKNHSKKLVK